MTVVDRVTKRLPPHWPHLALLTVGCLGLYLYGIGWGLPNVNDWANLSLAPTKPLSFAKHLLYGERWLFHYPPLHFIVLALVYSPYVLYLLLTGGLQSPTDVYPFGLADPETSLSVLILLARLVSVVMGVGLVLVNYLTVRRFYGAMAGLVSSILIASSYPIVYYAHSATVDIPHLFWLALALYSFVRLIESFQTKWYLLLALFTAFAVGTKHPAYAFAIGLIPSLVYLHYRNFVERHPGHSPVAAFLDRRFVYASCLFGVTLILIFNPILNWDGVAAHISHHTERSIRGSWTIQAASGRLRGHLDLVGDYVEYIRQSNGLPVFVLMAAGFLYCLVRYPKQSLIIGLPIVTYYVLYLKNFGTNHLRYVLPVYLLCTWQAGKLAADALATRSMPRWVPRVGLALIIGSSLLYGATVHYMYAHDARYDAERWIGQHIPAGAKVLAIEPDYTWPRFPKHLDVAHRELWDFNGNRTADITDLGAEWVVVGMSIPRRGREISIGPRPKFVKDIDVEGFLTARGYRPVGTFHTSLPAWGADVPDIHALHPRVVIWQRADGRQPSATSAGFAPRQN
jgi:hypothetical protein